MTTATCSVCSKTIEIITLGWWFADHEKAEPGSELCPGSGTSPPKPMIHVYRNKEGFWRGRCDYLTCWITSGKKTTEAQANAWVANHIEEKHLS